MPEAVECTLGILRERMQRQGIEIDVDVPADLPPLDGAQDDLQRILLNLLSNAGDAMPSGGVLWVRARAGGRTLRLVVEDTGCGIAPEDIARIQEPFVTTKATGSGVGVSICRSIIWQLGGKLEINSAPDKGTRVIVKLPTRRPRRRQS